MLIFTLQSDQIKQHLKDLLHWHMYKQSVLVLALVESNFPSPHPCEYDSSPLIKLCSSSSPMKFDYFHPALIDL